MAHDNWQLVCFTNVTSLWNLRKIKTWRHELWSRAFKNVNEGNFVQCLQFGPHNWNRQQNEEMENNVVDVEHMRHCWVVENSAVNLICRSLSSTFCRFNHLLTIISSIIRLSIFFYIKTGWRCSRDVHPSIVSIRKFQRALDSTQSS